MIIIKKLLSKTISITTERDFLKKDDMISTKQCLFEFIIKEPFVFREIKKINNRLITFIKIKNVNNCLICVLSFNLNKFNKIFFINVIFENVKK